MQLDPSTFALFGFGLMSVLLGAWGWHRISVRHRKRKHQRTIHKRRRRAAQGEQEAEVLLQNLGYRVEERQVEEVWTIALDDHPIPITVRADLLVTRGGETFIAEVKTGRQAPRITNAGTRRQLLEYRLAYPDIDGVLLIDAETENVHHVRFPFLPENDDAPPKRLSFLWGVVTGAALVVAALWWLGKL